MQPKTTQKINFTTKRFLKIILGKFLGYKALMSGKAFYCQVLSGTSSYNLCINSDLTVSCNCQDFDGSGQLGSLEESRLKEILSGKKAMEFRNKLANSILPVHTCTTCTELRHVDRTKAPWFVENFSVPKKAIMLENTVCCNLSCIACARNDVMKIRARSQMSLEHFEKVSLEIRENQIQQVAFYNLGEPFLSKNIKEELQILRKYNPQVQIVVSTNGVLVNSDDKRDAAMNLNHIFFSIDGVSTQMVNRYQRNSNFEIAYKNLKDFVSYRNLRKQKEPLIEWAYIVFNWNDKNRYLNRAITLAKMAGVDRISFWPTISPFYGASWRYLLGLSLRKRIGWRVHTVKF